jgi:hypothetical protein
MMSSPDDYGKRREPTLVQRLQQEESQEPFRVIAPVTLPPSPHIMDPEERARPVLDAVAADVLWIPWDQMETWAKEMLGEDGKAGVIVQWAKKRLGRT